MDLARIAPDRYAWYLCGWENGFLAGAEQERADQVAMFTPEAIASVKRAAATDTRSTRTRINCPGRTPEEIRRRAYESWGIAPQEVAA